MPRYNPYGSRQMQPEQYDTGDVPYISYQDPDADKIIAQGMQNMQQRYDLTQSAMGKYMEENAKGDFSDKDYVPVMSNLNSRLEKIRQNVKDKYQGDYGAAANEVIQELGKARNIFFQAEAEKKKEDKYGPLLDKMKAEKKLLWEPGKGDPRERAAFDENGNYAPRDYSGFVEKSDYEKLIAEDFVKGIDKKSIEGGLGNSNIDGILQSVTRQGLAVFGDTPEQQNAGVDKLVDAYLPVFKQNSTAKLDPEFKDDNDIKDYIKKTVFGMASNVVSRQNMGDPNFDKNKGTPDPNQPTPPKLTRLYSTSTIGDKQDLSDVTLSDPSFKGQLKKDLIKSLWTNSNGEIDAQKFTDYLTKYNTSLYGKDPKFNLSSYIVKDENNEVDVDKTLNAIEVETGKLRNLGRGIGPAPLLNSLNKFLDDLNAHTKTKLEEKFGDYGVDVMGFDFDKNSQDVKKSMDTYISTISPDVFNFETGKFADIKTSKLSNNKEFIKTRGDGNFKIQGVIKSPDGGVKYIAEDGSGEPQVVSSNSDVVNRKLLQMFGSPELIGNYEYRDFKITPSGNSVVYKPVGSKEEKRLKLKGGYKVEKDSNGKYKLIDSNNNIYKENGQPRLFDKWEVIHSVGVK